jgi:hypothetical protein
VRLLVLGQRAGRALHPAIAVGGVEEVDAEIVRVIHDRFGLGGRGQRPEVHGPEAQPAHGKAGTAKVDEFHAANPFTAPPFHSSGVPPAPPASSVTLSLSGVPSL